MHYSRWQRHGDIDYERAGKQVCVIEGCDGFRVSHGLCDAHRMRLVRNGDPLGGRYDWTDDVGYGGVHGRLIRTYGLAREHLCVDCGEQALDWSYTHGCLDERLATLPSGSIVPYCVHLNCYRTRCRKCHRAYDTTPETELRVQVRA